MSTPIATKNLRKQFGIKTVLRGIDLEVPTGTVLGLVGKNGSGKSTLLKCILGLLRITKGEARVFEDDAWHLSAETKSQLGYVPQEVVTYPWMRVRQVIAYTASFYPNWNPELVVRLCNQWDLPLEERAGTLSAGQLQTLGIVLAMGHEPELLVLDEPVASLDPSARRQFLQTILEVIDHPGRTILFSSHITSDLERVANRVAILKDGKFAFDGDLGDLKDRMKRLRFQFPHEVPSHFAVDGALHLECNGSSATACVGNFDEEELRNLRTAWDAEVSVQDLNLEEIFVELHR